MFTILPSSSRGYRDHGWLKTYHSFSFADFYDPDKMGFGPLRVLNEDYIAAKKGFGAHSHANMEIVTIILSGQIEHTDSSGGHGILNPGDVQYMCAGTGVTHSEVNPSNKETHLLQIWFLPPKNNLPVSYQQENVQTKGLTLVASPTGPLKTHRDLSLWLGSFDKGTHVHTPKKGRCCYLFVINGKVSVNSHELRAGDALQTDQKIDLSFAKARFVLFDVAIS